MTPVFLPSPAPRTMICERCGAAFSCDLSKDCWCAAEQARLPLPPGSGSDCLCPACLRNEAQGAGQTE